MMSGSIGNAGGTYNVWTARVLAITKSRVTYNMRWGRRRHHCAPGYARARIFMCAVAETVWPKRLIWRCDFIWVNAASINYSRNSATAERSEERRVGRECMWLAGQW